MQRQGKIFGSLAKRTPADAAVFAAIAGGSGASSRQRDADPAERLSERSIYIRVRPAPVSLSERRSVLRILERYGKTEFFKKLADEASFVAITTTAAMAKTMIQRSPFQYEFLSDTAQSVKPWGSPLATSSVQVVEVKERVNDAKADKSTDSSVDADNRERTSTTTNAESVWKSAEQKQLGAVEQKTFTVSVFPTNDYHHQSLIRNTPTHGPWPRRAGSPIPGSTVSDNKHSFVYNALRAVLPNNVLAEGLADWRRDKDRLLLGSGGHDHEQDSRPGSHAARQSMREAIAAQVHKRQLRRALLNSPTMTSLLTKNWQRRGAGGRDGGNSNALYGSKSDSYKKDGGAA